MKRNRKHFDIDKIEHSSDDEDSDNDDIYISKRTGNISEKIPKTKISGFFSKNFKNIKNMKNDEDSGSDINDEYEYEYDNEQISDDDDNDDYMDVLTKRHSRIHERRNSNIQSKKTVGGFFKNFNRNNNESSTSDILNLSTISSRSRNVSSILNESNYSNNKSPFHNDKVQKRRRKTKNAPKRKKMTNGNKKKTKPLSQINIKFFLNLFQKCADNSLSNCDYSLTDIDNFSELKKLLREKLTNLRVPNNTICFSSLNTTKTKLERNIHQLDNQISELKEERDNLNQKIKFTRSFVVKHKKSLINSNTRSNKIRDKKLHDYLKKEKPKNEINDEISNMTDFMLYEDQNSNINYDKIYDSVKNAIDIVESNNKSIEPVIERLSNTTSNINRILNQ